MEDELLLTSGYNYTREAEIVGSGSVWRQIQSKHLKNGAGLKGEREGAAIA
ncbi:MAG: hypothetical protein WCS37_08280 [Chloroflexota bacterium]|nr:hypothetical protein [Chloroflexota bacterium]